MGPFAGSALAIAALLTAPLLAASRVTVEQLSEMLASAHASRLPDDEIAAELGGIELTERLTEPTLARLWPDQGGRTKVALWILVDESAFLDPPVSELPSDRPPDLAEQKTILAKAMSYALAYMNNLPNFRCKQLTRRFQGDPLAPMPHPAGVAGHLHLRDTVETELSFDNGAELRRSGQPTEGLTTSGEFGGILASPFFGGAANAKWSHWEMLDGKRIAGFDYTVKRAHSNFDLSWCCFAGDQHWLHKKVAYEGALFIEPGSGAVFRITRQAMNIPDGFPTRRADTVVEYRPVNVGGKLWLCPVRSITLSDSQVAHGWNERHPPQVHILNVVQFTDYHKFGSESTVVMAEIPATGQPDVSVPPPVSIEPPPELTATYQPASVPSLLFGIVESLPPPPAPKAPEALVDTQAIFRVRTNVVTVRVVVRDRNGHPISDLRKEEFELRDNGQLQTISSFSVERPTAANLRPISLEHATKPVGEQAVVHEPVQMAYRYVMYVVDDLNIEFGDLSQTRAAAERVLRDSPDSASRVAVLTTSGRIITDFTSNLADINKALDRITPQGRANVKGRCPPLTYGLALAVTRGDGLPLAIAEARACGLVNDPGNPRAPAGPDNSTVASAQRGVVLSVASQVVNEYRTQT